MVMILNSDEFAAHFAFFEKRAFAAVYFGITAMLSFGMASSVA
jgi:hypothetical protein